MARNILSRRAPEGRSPVVRVRLAAPAARILVVGGARSGKSAFAQAMAERFPGTLLYVATMVESDPESQERVRSHRERRGPRWKVVEAGTSLASALSACPEASCVLVDSLGLWVSGVLCGLLGQGGETGDDEEREAGRMETLTRETIAFVEAFRATRRPVIVVTDEVGMGLVPPDRLSRSFRDALGLVNQGVGQAATEAYLVSCGLPVRLKGRGSQNP